jgi:hypothetical protein
LAAGIALSAVALLAGVALGTASGWSVGVPRSAGASRLGGNQDDSSVVAGDVRVTTDRDGYAVGEPIEVLVANDRGAVIYLAGAQTFGSPVAVERLDGGAWAAVGLCEAGDAQFAALLAAGGRLAVRLSPAESTAQVIASTPGAAAGPVVGEPMAPAESSGDLSRLPTLTPATGPGQVVPEGEARPPRCVGGPLGPGTYRLAVRFAPTWPAADWQIAYSAPIAIRG